MMKSFASGISSIKGTPLNPEKINIQQTTKNSPFCEIITKTPKGKMIFSNLKQTSSSLLRKAQAMNKPIHSNRKLFNDEEEKSVGAKSKLDENKLNDKENACRNGKQSLTNIQSPIPSVKGMWNQTGSVVFKGKTSLTSSNRVDIPT